MPACPRKPHRRSCPRRKPPPPGGRPTPGRGLSSVMTCSPASWMPPPARWTMPLLGGAAPVVAVAVTAENLETGTGCGFIGETPISMAAVRQFACTGGMQKIVFDQDGRILQLGSLERIFTAQQRRAIILRDGECCVPGCHMPGALSEIHHVDPAASGGRLIPTTGWCCAGSTTAPWKPPAGIPHGKRLTAGEIPALARRVRQVVPHRQIRHPQTSQSQPQTTTKLAG